MAMICTTNYSYASSSNQQEHFVSSQSFLTGCKFVFTNSLLLMTSFYVRFCIGRLENAQNPLVNLGFWSAQTLQDRLSLADSDFWELLMIWLYFRRESLKLRTCSIKEFSSIILNLSRIIWLLQKMMAHNDDITIDNILWFNKESQVRILVGKV